MPYKWKVIKSPHTTSIQILFLNHPTIRSISSVIDQEKKEILVSFDTPCKHLSIDPFMHPLGPLLMIYLSHFSKGFLIHASGINIHDKGYLFTARSGTGKTTIANLFQKEGGVLINDDRLWIEKINGQWFMFNTPMEYYSSTPKHSRINKISLLQQARSNNLKKLQGLKASMLVMSNCIQHFFEHEMAQIHLESVLQFSTVVPIYLCTFKPDSEIVDMLLLKD